MTGIEFYIGLPIELNYKVARYFADKLNWDGLKSFIKSLFDATNREITMKMFASGMSKESTFSKLIANSKHVSNVSNNIVRGVCTFPV